MSNLRRQIVNIAYLQLRVNQKKIHLYKWENEAPIKISHK